MFARIPVRAPGVHHIAAHAQAHSFLQSLIWCCKQEQCPTKWGMCSWCVWVSYAHTAPTPFGRKRIFWPFVPVPVFLWTFVWGTSKPLGEIGLVTKKRWKRETRKKRWRMREWLYENHKYTHVLWIYWWSYAETCIADYSFLNSFCLLSARWFCFIVHMR